LTYSTPTPAKSCSKPARSSPCAPRVSSRKGRQILRVQDEDLYGQYIAADLYNPQTGEIFAEAGDEISAKSLPLLIEAGFDELPLLDIDHI